jgi:hypothetical protein
MNTGKKVSGKYPVFFAAFFFVLPSISFGHSVRAHSYYFTREISTEYAEGTGEKEIKEIAHEEVFAQDKMIKVTKVESDKIRIIRLDRKFVYDIDTEKKVYKERNLHAFDILKKQKKIQSSISDSSRNIGRQYAQKKLLQSTTKIDTDRQILMRQMIMQQQAAMSPQKKIVDNSEKGEPVVLKWTNDVKRLKGYSCKRFKIIRGKRRLYEGWVTEEIGPHNYYSDFIATNELFTSVTINTLKKVTGFPMREKYRIQTGQFKGAIQKVKVTLIEKRPLMPSEFEVPTGYVQDGVSAAPAESEEEKDHW